MSTRSSATPVMQLLDQPPQLGRETSGSPNGYKTAEGATVTPGKLDYLKRQNWPVPPPPAKSEQALPEVRRSAAVGALEVAKSEEVEELVDGELVVGRSLPPAALTFARLQNSPETQRSYGSVYRTFSTYLGAAATVEALTPETLATYRGWLLDRGRLPHTIANHLSALKQLAKALGVENFDTVKGPKPPRPTPRALTDLQVKHLLNAAQASTAKGEAAVGEARKDQGEA
jgi:hypothetical protein